MIAQGFLMSKTVSDENAVQMVDLMLKGDGEQAVGMPDTLLAFQGDTFHSNPFVALNIGREVRNREAALLFEGLTFCMDNNRVNNGVQLWRLILGGNVNDDQSL